MTEQLKRMTRRGALKAMGVWGAAAAVVGTGSAAPAAAAGSGPPSESAPGGPGLSTNPTREADRGDRPDDFRRELRRLVDQTPMVDTHEHLPDEEARLRGEMVSCDDWGALLGQYLDSDLAVAGMPDEDLHRLITPGTDPVDKWPLLAPHWPAVKNTGYGLAVRIAMQELYGIEELSASSIPHLQAGYEAVRRPGFYHKILVEKANIESCQVDSMGSFRESRNPTLLMQDINIVGMHVGPDIKRFAEPAGVEVRDLDGWHAVIRWWFEKYAAYAVAVKSQAAYGRGLDYEQVSAEDAAPVFKRVLEEAPVSPEEQKRLEDHLFWYVVEQATKHELPVKLHTGYYAGQDYMPLERVAGNAAEAAALCRRSPQTQWVFMHIAYPYWQDLLAVAKHYRCAHLDMCWAWLMDPVSSTEFLKSYLLTAPANKVFVFGGDYMPVECVLGHAQLARQGVVRALAELVDGQYLSRRDALELVEPLLRGNPRKVYRLEAKTERLSHAPWIAA
jgi:uncharacterized protein